MIEATPSFETPLLRRAAWYNIGEAGILEIKKLFQYVTN
jgi:hypothetical protein